jgi:antitoxin component YwqK of YwqJK toxin-antitoxin module
MLNFDYYNFLSRVELKIFISLLILSSILVCCGIKKPHDGLSTPLVFRNGLYYADSTSTTPFTGRNRSQMMDQTIEYDVVNGVREGDFIIYYPNNKIQMIGKLSNNKNVGEWKYYFINGELESVGQYVDDKPSGSWKWYSPGEKLLEEGNFVDGKKDGVWKNYDSLGVLRIIRTYKQEVLVDSLKIE